MLKDRNGYTIKEIQISAKIKKEMVENIKSGNIKKLEASRKLIPSDLEISAGLYTYSVEELGKLLLLNKIKTKSGKCTLKYSREFVDHDKKFETAFDYFQKNNLEELSVINEEGGFSVKGFSWRSFRRGLLTDTQARLSIFYSDFKYSTKDSKDEDIVVQNLPTVSREILEKNVNKLESFIRSNQWIID
jgi:hypothetical protein